MARCRSCNAEIVWVKLESGKRMPVDPEPHENGNVQIDVPNRYDAHGNVMATVLGPLEKEATDDPLYLSHFVTCPQAKEWRRSG